MSTKKTFAEKFDPAKIEDSILSLQSEKNHLYIKLSDSKINLKNCKENLVSIISTSDNLINDYNRTSINEIISDNDTLLKKLSEAIKIKNSNDNKLNSITINLDSKYSWEREKIASHNNEIYYMNTKLKEKDQIIENLRLELEKYISHELEFKKEIYLVDPKKANIDAVNEIAYSKDIIRKISVIYENEKKSKVILDADLNSVQKEYDTLNRYKNGLSTFDNSKKDLKFVSTNLNRAVKGKIDYNSTNNLNLSELNSNKPVEDSYNNNLEIRNNLNFSKMSKLSANESEIKFDLNEQENLEEIQNIIFPDKIIMKHSSTLNHVDSLVPRLDMKQVYQKYQTQSNMHIVKPSVKKKENSIINSQNNSILNKQSFHVKKNTGITLRNKIVSLKNEVNHTKEIIQDLESDLAKFQKVNKENKIKLSKTKDNIKIADSKIENLKNQIKAFLDKEFDEEMLENDFSDSESYEEENSDDNSSFSMEKDNEKRINFPKN